MLLVITTEQQEMKSLLRRTSLKGEVVHHLQASHHQQVWLEVYKFLSKLLQGVQVGVVVIAVDNIPGEHKKLLLASNTSPWFKFPSYLMPNAS